LIELTARVRFIVFFLTGTKYSLAQMRVCVFCGGRAGSNEHIIAKRLAKRMQLERYVVQGGAYDELEGVQFRKSHLLNAHTVGKVCQSCNNKWMNDLEATFEDYLGPLIEPQWPVNADEVIEAAKPAAARIARWAMKSAVMFDLSSLQKTKVMDPMDFPRIMRGQFTKNVLVSLAHAKTDGIWVQLTSGFKVAQNGQVFPNQKHTKKKGFHRALQFNHLLLRAAYFPDAEPGTFEDPSQRSPIWIFPVFKRFNKDSYSYDKFPDFFDSFGIQT
jgi:hypothetical protein